MQSKHLDLILSQSTVKQNGWFPRVWPLPGTSPPLQMLSARGRTPSSVQHTWRLRPHSALRRWLGTFGFLVCLAWFCFVCFLYKITLWSYLNQQSTQSHKGGKGNMLFHASDIKSTDEVTDIRKEENTVSFPICYISFNTVFYKLKVIKWWKVWPNIIQVLRAFYNTLFSNVRLNAIRGKKAV